MIGILYLIIDSLWIYITFPEITKIIKAPPIAPLIPYFPEIFGVKNLFPPFYFTYFIIALLIVAVVHEFSHGIFMRLAKIRIKSTGFVCLGPILGAFVEQDEKQMKEKNNLEQMSVMSAGVFANLLFALIFFGLLVGFFLISFQPSGYIFNMYSAVAVPTKNISGFGNLSSNLTEIYAGNQTYYMDSYLKTQLNQNLTSIIVYDNSPALKSELKGVIVEVNGQKITNQKDLEKFLVGKKPGENISITTLQTNNNNTEKTYNITLAKHPQNSSQGYIGITFLQAKSNGIISGFMNIVSSFKDSSVYYSQKWDGDFPIFIYNLLWWVAVINLLVALFNMLPLSILDGGRFFYLGVLSVTKSKKFANICFKFISYVIVLIFILMTLFWFFRII